MPVIRIGVDDRFGYSASAKQILQDFGLCSDNIAQKVREAAARKAK